MIRYLVTAVAQWYISRSIDVGRPLPSWVTRRLARDPALERFYVQSLRLANQLGAEAGAPLSSSDVRRTALPPMRRRSVVLAPASVLVGLVAVLLYVQFSKLFDSTTADVDRSHSNVVADSQPPLPDAELAEVPPSKPPSKPPSMPLENTLAMEPHEVRAWLVFDLQRAFKPVGQVGSRYGALLSEFDQRLEEDQRRLIAEGASVWDFFVNKLPDSVATLAGQ